MRRLLAIALLSLVAAQPAAAAWSPPVPVPGAEDANGGTVGFSAAGRSILAWTSTDAPDGCYVHCYISFDGRVAARGPGAAAWGESVGLRPPIKDATFGSYGIVPDGESGALVVGTIRLPGFDFDEERGVGVFAAYHVALDPTTGEPTVLARRSDGLVTTDRVP